MRQADRRPSPTAPRRRRAGRPRPHDGLLLGRPRAGGAADRARRAPRRRAPRAFVVADGKRMTSPAAGARRSAAAATATSCSTTRTSRAATPRSAPAGARLDDRRPRLDQRRARQRPARRPARRRSQGGDRVELGTVARALRGRMTCSTPSPSLLKFGFLAVLYLFLLWVSRSALKDLRRSNAQLSAPGRGLGRPRPTRPAMHAAPASRGRARRRSTRGWSSSARPGTPRGWSTRSASGAVLGRGDQAEIRLEDPFASSRHARLVRAGQRAWSSRTSARRTAPTSTRSCSAGPQPLHPGDRVRIGDSEFTYMEGG